MIGAIIGDIIGSRFEFNNLRGSNFKLFTDRCSYTDDTICTIAIAEAILRSESYGVNLQKWCRKYPHPMGSYGARFSQWIWDDMRTPYNSFGNGSAMRVSPVAWAFNEDFDVMKNAIDTAAISHNHTFGIHGAMVVALAIYASRKFKKESYCKGVMRELCDKFFPEPIKRKGVFDETCQGTVPVAADIIIESNSFEDAIRKAMQWGGDSDTLGAIVGSIAEAIWGIPEEIYNKAMTYLTQEMKDVVINFRTKFNIDTII